MTTLRTSETWTEVEVRPGCAVWRFDRAWYPGERLRLEPSDARQLAYKRLVTVVRQQATKARHIG